MRTFLLALLTLVLAPAAAKADTYSFNLSFTGTYSGSAVLIGDSNPNGSFTITGVSGSTLTQILPPNSDGFGNNNLFFPSGSNLFDASGLGLLGGIGQFDIYKGSGAGYLLKGFDPQNKPFTGTEAVTLNSSTLISSSTVTPEPSSLVLCASGVLVAGLFFSWRRLGANSSGAALA